MAHFKAYTVKSGMRWDAVAHEVYGDFSLFNDIIADNPEVPIYEVLPAGTVLKIRVISAPASTTAIDKLPPWKQS